MINRVFDKYFLAYCLSWLVVHGLRRLNVPVNLLNDHVTDFVFVPVVAHLTLFVMRRYILRNMSFYLPLSYLLFIAVYSSLVFEWLLPLHSPRYTADRMDVIAYFAGALFYYFIHQPRVLKDSC